MTFSPSRRPHFGFWFRFPILAEREGISLVTRAVSQLAGLVRCASNPAQSGFESLLWVQEFLLGIKNSMYEKYNRYAHYFTQHWVTYSLSANKICTLVGCYFVLAVFFERSSNFFWRKSWKLIWARRGKLFFWGNGIAPPRLSSRPQEGSGEECGRVFEPFLFRFRISCQLKTGVPPLI